MNPAGLAAVGPIAKKSSKATSKDRDPVQKSPKQAATATKKTFAPTLAPPATDAIQGIRNRDGPSWRLFRKLARGDFKHDFGEGVETRDKFVAGDAQRFFDIAKLVTKKGSVWLRAKFLENVGTNLFRLIEDKINTILPRPVTSDSSSTLTSGESFVDEDALLGSMGIDWKKLKDEIMAAGPPDETGVAPVLTKSLATGAVAGGRPYEIRACSYRLGKKGTDDYKTNRAPIDALRIVTGTPAGEDKIFACIVDASGGFPLSDLRNRDLLTRESGTDTVFIIENLENGADSATKLLPPPILPKKDKGLVLNTEPQLRILRDTETTVNYPLWANSSDPKSNIYSSFHIVLNRAANDTVEANILSQNSLGVTTEAYSIGDVSNASNVKNASLYGLAMILENGVTNEALVYTLIKRMGDWCQALSLLDLDRVYTPTNPDTGVVGDPMTLRQLQANGAEIGIVTNDRILLAFSIFLGLNVFYTSAMDIAQLIYFKNTLVTSSPTAISDRVQKTLTSVTMTATTNAVPPQMESIAKTRTDMLKQLADEKSLPAYIGKLRNLLSNLARLRLDLPALVSQLNEAYTVATDPANEPTVQLTAANSVVSLLAKIRTDTIYNESVLRDIQAGIYPDSKKEAMQLGELEERMKSKGRLAKTIGVTNAKDILKRVAEDIDQVLGKTPDFLLPLRTTPEDFGIPQAEENAYATFKEILSVMPALSLRLSRPKQKGGAQEGGGGLEDLESAVAALTTTTVRVLGRDETEATSTVNIYKIGSLYYDRTLTGYTVVDEYIIRKEDLAAFDLAFKALVAPGVTTSADPSVQSTIKSVCQRYLLLRVDLALNTLNTLLDMSASHLPAAGDRPEAEVPGATERGTPGYAELTRLNLLYSSIVLAIGTSGQDLVRRTLSIYKPNPDAVSILQLPLPSLDAKFKELRESLIRVLATGPPDDTIKEERAETAAREKALGTVVTMAMQDVEIVDSLVPRLKMPPGTSPETLGKAIRAAIAGAVVESVGPDTTPEITAEEIVQVPGLTEAIQRVVAEELGVDTYNSGIIETIISSIQQTRNRAPPVRQAAAVGLPGFQGGGESTPNAPNSPPGSSRRGLYSRLRKRGGEGPDPQLG